MSEGILRTSGTVNLKVKLSRIIARVISLPIVQLVEAFLLRRQFEKLYFVFGGHIFFQTMRTAVQLDLFTLLAREGRMTRQQIAEKLGLEEQPVRIVLLGLTTSGLLRKRGSYYSNTYLSKLLLNTDSPRKITAYVELQHQAMYKGLYWMHESVRENRNVGLKEFPGNEPTLYQRLAHSPQLERTFQEAMQELSVQSNVGLANHLDLSKVRRLVDVGGGNATNIIALAKHFPHLQASVFDSPTVCKLASSNIANNGLSDRLNAVPGDGFKDAFPAGTDCLMFAHFCTIWSKEKNLELFKKSFASLPAGGRIVIFNMMQDDSETGPMSAAVGSPYFLSLATGTGMLYTWNEYESWLREAGFLTVKRQRLLRDHGVIVGIKK